MLGKLFKDWKITLAAAMSLAVIASALARAIVQGGEAEHWLDAISKIAGSVVALMVFVVAATALLSNARSTSFEETLKRELDAFIKRHKPFILVLEEYTGVGDKNGATYGILEHHEDMLKKGETFSADLYTPFFSLPVAFTKGSQIIFYFDDDTFAAALKEKNIGSVANLRKDIANAVSSEFSDIVKAHAFSEISDRRMFINLNKHFDTPEEAHEIIHLLDYVFIHYLAIA
ncbi:MAG: hypothetical protein LBE78_09780 [Burkholderiaceae bacterium]|nr:hypothetical protein [Burkholderiaceae bacterium]